MENKYPIGGYVKATEITKDLDIQPGHKIRLYGKETVVTGFHVAYNDALEKWETIILTERRGDPFERSLDVIEVLEDQPRLYKERLASSYQPLFEHMHQEHGLTLLESEMSDIIALVRKMEQEPSATPSKESDAVEFMNWTLMSECIYSATDEDQWTHTETGENITTEQLYELFLKQKEVKS